ncbi:MAG: aminodeoxychorismate synthase component I [Candidatus Dasytiphilus stammeri]
MRCLIIDNYDSFTWNLVDYVSLVFKMEPLVVRNDQYSWNEIKEQGNIHSIIISPGAGSVTNEKNFYISRQALAQNEIPILGVCLGFHGLAYHYGANIIKAPNPCHGLRSTIYHTGQDLFKNIPTQFEAVRYHSLIVSPINFPKILKITARTQSGIIMGIQHIKYPKWGVQFHPESVLSEYGKQIFHNFKNLVEMYIKNSADRIWSNDKICYNNNSKNFVNYEKKTQNKRFFCQKITIPLTPEEIFINLFSSHENCFWLDSQSFNREISRFSFMGSVDDQSHILKCYLDQSQNLKNSGGNLVAFLDQELQSVIVDSNNEVPFEFCGGYIGFMTYEMKSVFTSIASYQNNIPDAIWMRVEQFIAFDHTTGLIWLVALGNDNKDTSAQDWIKKMRNYLYKIQPKVTSYNSLSVKKIIIDLNASSQEYLELIRRCQDYIYDGESYEICLCNLLSFEAFLDPVKLYRFMRKDNPAPFGAFIRNGKNCILSTSPEQFLKVDSSGTIYTKPIKGTSIRSNNVLLDFKSAQRLASSEKNRAENLMIVDLMRNDLRQVSFPGSISVTKLMNIESYKTVHQMVSTIEGKLLPDCSLIDILRVSFPGGSITGAPKYRTMQLINCLEQSSRGVYCGSIGYLGFNRIADLNIAIRSLSYNGKIVKFGAGGAITFLSNPEKEFQEFLIKAESILQPLYHYFINKDSELRYQLQGKKLILE